MTRRVPWRVAFVAVGVWLGVACGSDSTEEKIALAKLTEGCLINTDCTDPLVCAFRSCHVQCETSRDCDDGQRCMLSDRPFHVCQLPSEKDCGYNSDCPEGQLCGVDGECRDQCAADRDCVAEQVCVTGTCAEPAELSDGGLPHTGDAGANASGQPCSYDSECGEGFACRGGLCNYQCLGDRDCFPGQACVERRCVYQVCAGQGPSVDGGGACQYSSECPAPLVCRSGVCDCECLESRDCQTGYECASYRCVPAGSAG